MYLATLFVIGIAFLESHGRESDLQYNQNNIVQNLLNPHDGHVNAINHFPSNNERTTIPSIVYIIKGFPKKEVNNNHKYISNLKNPTEIHENGNKNENSKRKYQIYKYTAHGKAEESILPINVGYINGQNIFQNEYMYVPQGNGLNQLGNENGYNGITQVIYKNKDEENEYQNGQTNEAPRNGVYYRIVYTMNNQNGNGYTNGFDTGNRQNLAPHIPNHGSDYTNGYSQNSNSYSQSNIGYSQNSNGPTQTSNGYTQNSNGHTQTSNGYTQNSNGYIQNSNGFIQSSNGYNEGIRNGYHGSNINANKMILLTGENLSNGNGYNTHGNGHPLPNDVQMDYNGHENTNYRPVSNQNVGQSNGYIYSFSDDDGEQHNFMLQLNGNRNGGNYNYPSGDGNVHYNPPINNAQINGQHANFQEHYEHSAQNGGYNNENTIHGHRLNNANHYSDHSYKQNGIEHYQNKGEHLHPHDGNENKYNDDHFNGKQNYFFTVGVGIPPRFTPAAFGNNPQNGHGKELEKNEYNNNGNNEQYLTSNGNENYYNGQSEIHNENIINHNGYDKNHNVHSGNHNGYDNQNEYHGNHNGYHENHNEYQGNHNEHDDNHNGYYGNHNGHENHNEYKGNHNGYQHQNGYNGFDSHVPPHNNVQMSNFQNGNGKHYHTEIIPSQDYQLPNGHRYGGQMANYDYQDLKNNFFKSCNCGWKELHSNTDGKSRKWRGLNDQEGNVYGSNYTDIEYYLKNNKYLNKTNDYYNDAEENNLNDTNESLILSGGSFDESNDGENHDIKPIIIKPPRKHYKIIYVNSPTQPTIMVQPEKEKKTLVYVLVKKPEEQATAEPSIMPTEPNKPDVFFVQYGTQNNTMIEESAGLKVAEDRIGDTDEKEIINNEINDIEMQDGVTENMNITDKMLT